jgi:hypothetical protein
MKDKLLQAENCVPIHLNWFKEGGIEVFRINDSIYVVFEVPRHGGEPDYLGTYNIEDIDKMIMHITSWTS